MTRRRVCIGGSSGNQQGVDCDNHRTWRPRRCTGPDGETTFRLRTALSPYEVEKAAARVGWDALGALAGAAGADRMSALIDGLAGGQEAREAAAEAGVGVSENGDGQAMRAGLSTISIGPLSGSSRRGTTGTGRPRSPSLSSTCACWTARPANGCTTGRGPPCNPACRRTRTRETPRGPLRRAGGYVSSHRSAGGGLSGTHDELHPV